VKPYAYSLKNSINFRTPAGGLDYSYGPVKTVDRRDCSMQAFMMKFCALVLQKMYDITLSLYNILYVSASTRPDYKLRTLYMYMIQRLK